MLLTLRELAARPGWAPIQQLATWSRRQWKVAAWSYLAALLIMGVAGETLPGASSAAISASTPSCGPAWASSGTPGKARARPVARVSIV